MPRRLRRSFAFIIIPNGDHEGSSKPVILAAASEPELGAWLGALASAGALVPLTALPSPCPQQAETANAPLENSCVSHQSHASHHSFLSADSCRSLCAVIKQAWNRNPPQASANVSDVPISVGAVSLSSCRSLLDAIRGNAPEYLQYTHASLAAVAEVNSEPGSRTSSPKRSRQIERERTAEDEIALAKAESPKRVRRGESQIAREIERASQSTSPNKARRNSRESLLSQTVQLIEDKGASSERLQSKSASNDSRRGSRSATDIQEAEDCECSTRAIVVTSSHLSSKVPLASKPANSGYPNKPGHGQSDATKKQRHSSLIPAMPEVSFGMPQRPNTEESASVEECEANRVPASTRLARRCPLQAYIDEIECHAPPERRNHREEDKFHQDELSNSWKQLKNGLSQAIVRKDHAALKYYRDAKIKRRLSKNKLGRPSQNSKDEEDWCSDKAESGRLM